MKQPKKYQMKLFYSVHNGGDGSAYPHLMESLELAEWDQAHMNEGWGETCTGTFEVESDSPITIMSEVSNRHSFLIDYILNGFQDDYYHETGDSIETFIKKFFPDGVPPYTIEKVEGSLSNFGYGNYYTFNIKVGDIVVDTRSAKDGVLLEIINEYSTN